MDNKYYIDLIIKKLPMINDINCIELILKLIIKNISCDHKIYCSPKSPGKMISQDKPYPLQNPGNYCFLNAGIQSIFSCEEFKGRLGKFPATKLSVQHELMKLMQGLGNTSKFRNLLREYREDLFTGEQQDSFEFVIFLLETINTELAAEKDEGREGSTLISSLFGAKVRRNNLCKSCGEISELEEQCNVFSLRPNYLTTNLESVVNQIFKPETKTKRWCDSCEEENLFQSEMHFKNAPKFLIIRLDRFSSDSPKNSISIRIPEGLELPLAALPSSPSPLRYCLVSFVNHFGVSVNSGHYTATVRRGNKWFECNDFNCKETDNPCGKSNSNIVFLIFEKLEA